MNGLKWPSVNSEIKSADKFCGKRNEDYTMIVVTRWRRKLCLEGNRGGESLYLLVGNNHGLWRMCCSGANDSLDGSSSEASLQDTTIIFHHTRIRGRLSLKQATLDAACNNIEQALIEEETGKWWWALDDMLE